MGEELLMKYSFYHEREAIVAHVMETADRFWGDVLFLLQDLRHTLKIHRRANRELVADVGPRDPAVVAWFRKNGFDARVQPDSKRLLVYFPARATLLKIPELSN